MDTGTDGDKAPQDVFKLPTLPFTSPKPGGPEKKGEHPQSAATSESQSVAAEAKTAENDDHQESPESSLPSPSSSEAESSEPAQKPKPSVEAKSGASKASPAELAKAKSIPLPYQEPSWGGMTPADKKYSVEVLKNGTIVETIVLTDKSFFVIGRLVNCDIFLEHPSLSRYHAVIQYKSKGSPEKPVGFYLYDLDSTHGSYHNKNRCFPKTYYRLRVGHMMKFGGSTRTLILQGPEEDTEEETDLTITELKELQMEKVKKKQEAEEEKKRKAEEEQEESEQLEAAKGISWGMGEDAQDYPDMDKNPYAETADNESLYIDDPKKALKTWFDREGYELEYNVEEKGYAQFLCKIDLPIDTPSGESPTVEALVKGKKKEAVLQASLEACKMLDRLGLLRPSHQSAKEKKVKQWEEDDFYASDEDEFLDRTGTIERKRKNRMKIAGKDEKNVETYDSLMKKHSEAQLLLKESEQELKLALEKREKAKKRSENNDLDSYLVELQKGAQVDKETIQKLKMKILKLSQDTEKLARLINIAKPASMPELKVTPAATEKSKLTGIMIGKRGSRGLLGKTKSVAVDNKIPVVCTTQDTKVLEAFLNEAEIIKPKRTRRLGDDSDDEADELQPIGYEARLESKPAKPRIGDTSVNSRIQSPAARVVGAALPPAGQPEAAAGEMSSTARLTPRTASPAGDSMDTSDHLAAHDTEEVEKRKRGDRGSKRKKKVEEEEEEEEEEGGDVGYYQVGKDSKYDVWVPPSGQTGDGRTSLNDKLGY